MGHFKETVAIGEHVVVRLLDLAQCQAVPSWPGSDYVTLPHKDICQDINKVDPPGLQTLIYIRYVLWDIMKKLECFFGLWHVAHFVRAGLIDPQPYWPTT